MMLFPDRLVILRGGGDLGTGVAWRLTRAGFPVVVAELAEPLSIRRKVALSTAVDEGEIDVEGMVGVRVDSESQAIEVAGRGDVAVLVSDGLPAVDRWMVVDARLAKVNIDTTIDDAPLVVGLGPGFEAGADCHAVVETMRGHHLGRVIWKGLAAPNTGEPGDVGGVRAERVVRAPAAGIVTWVRAIGDRVESGEILGEVAGTHVHAGVAGVVRGMIADGRTVTRGLKIADVDPRGGTDPAEISDKARSIGGGVLEAALVWLNR